MVQPIDRVFTPLWMGIMPELPEVEIMTENLRGWIAGRDLQAFEVLDDLLLKEGDAEQVRGPVRAVRRVAKYVVVEVPDRTLVLHFRMTGKVVLEPTEGRIRARFVTRGGRPVAFKDARRLGEAWILEPSQVQRFFEDKDIGPEPWPDPLPGSWWAERFHGLRGPIKPALLRQDRVSGIGNIAASEILWRAAIDPTRPVNGLKARHWEAIAVETHAFLHASVETQRAPEIILVEEGGEGPFSVYGQEGSPCPRCGKRIQRLVQVGRSTFFCSKCQKKR